MNLKYKFIIKIVLTSKMSLTFCNTPGYPENDFIHVLLFPIRWYPFKQAVMAPILPIFVLVLRILMNSLYDMNFADTMLHVSSWKTTKNTIKFNGNFTLFIVL